ncbi:hypothetical protein LXL04_002593 [Taraxacum kok-saghyz]
MLCFVWLSVARISCHVVGSIRQECSTKRKPCWKWRLSGLPCGHVISILRSLNYDDCSPYANPAFTTETYRSTYEELIHPLPAPVDCEIPEDLMTVNVPVMEVPKPGRPKNKDRIPSQGEGPIIRKCSRCQKSGHRRDNCPAPVPRYSSESSRQRTKSNTIQATTIETDSVTASQIESQSASQTCYMFPTYGLQ